MKRILSLILIFVLCITCLAGCGKKSNYKSNGTWANLSNYMFAVEIDDFDGDVYEAGTYHFYPDLVDRVDSLMSSETPIVWDVYVSYHEYTKLSELKESEYVASIGGITKTEEDIVLKKGNYVYINYNEVLGEPAGILKFEKK